MTDSRKNKILQIAKYAMLVNSAKKGEPIIFFEFSGNVSWLHIRIYNTGWSENKKADVFYEIRICSRESSVKYKGTDWNPIDTDTALEAALKDLKNLYSKRRDKPCRTTD